MKPKTPLVRPASRRGWHALTLTIVLLLNSGCASESIRYLPTQSAGIPPLPTEARQVEPESICLPTCSAGLSRDLDGWLLLPTDPESPG